MSMNMMMLLCQKKQQFRSRYAKYVYYNCTQQEMKSIAWHQVKQASCLIYA